MDWVDSVLHIKRLFGVSYKTVLDRLVAEDLADSDIHRAFVGAYNNRYDGRLVFREESEAYAARSVEPSSMDKTDFFENRLARLVMNALDKHEITMSRAAEILGITVNEVRRRVR
jgi:DNA-binding NtrC family response regulator